jgi:histidinol-phosphate aminotransferase
MLNFIRPEITQLKAYTPHPGGDISIPVDQLDTNESPYDLPIEIKEKLSQIYQKEISTNRYPDGSHEKLKQAIAQYVNESVSSSVFNSNNISVGNGSDELIRSILIATCIGGSGSILVADPTFSMYEILAQTLGIKTHHINRNPIDFSIDPQEADHLLKQVNQNPPIKVIFVVHPNSPTANALTPTEINWLKTIDENILVVIDEAYFEFSQTTLATELNNHPNWIILRTFSKAFRLAAHRVGYAIANEEIITALEKIRLPYNLPSFSQGAALLAMENRDLILPVINNILNQRAKVYEKLCQFSSLKVWESNGNFIYARLKCDAEESPQKHQELVEKLKTKGTLIRHTGGGLRITIGTEEENNRTLNNLAIYLLT